MGTHLWWFVLSFLLVPSLISSAALAMMGQPTPLRRLIEEAKGAAIIRVESDGPRVSRPGGHDEPDSIATFVIERFVFDSGERPFRIHVKYHSTMICPPPPSYTVGERYFAFLYRDHAEWYPLLYRRGPIHSASDLEELAARVQAYRKLMAIADQSRRIAAELDWLVDCVAFRTTRSDALDEIAPEYILIDEPGELAGKLSTRQLDRLTNMIPTMDAGSVPGWHVGQLALLMKFRRHKGALSAILKWIRTCPTTPEILTFAWIAGACATLADKPDSQLPFMKQLGLTRGPEGSWFTPPGFYTLARRRAIMCSFVDHIHH